MNGIESYVYKKVLDNEVNWFPIGRAKCIEKESKSIKNEFTEKISTIQFQLKKIKESLLIIEKQQIEKQ